MLSAGPIDVVVAGVATRIAQGEQSPRPSPRLPDGHLSRPAIEVTPLQGLPQAYALTRGVAPG